MLYYKGRINSSKRKQEWLYFSKKKEGKQKQEQNALHK